MLKTDYKYIYFDEVEKKPKTSVYNVVSKDNNRTIGQIKWYASWRKYSFFPEANTVFETICLCNIIEFISNLMELRK